jgi:tight adherence protein B
MSVPLLLAGLVFIGIVAVIGGVTWALEGRRRLSARLSDPGVGAEWEADILRAAARGRTRRGSLVARLQKLAEEAGYPGARNEILLYMAGFALVGGVAAWLRTGGLLWMLLAAGVLGNIPVVFLSVKRQRRFRQFEEAFPDALDAMARAIRAGNALSGAIQIVGDESPDPVGTEFRRVFEEIRLGVDPGEALSDLTSRVPTEDVRFFCQAVRIQRGAGGNLAEILDRLSEVIRERFKILAHARVLSAQHKWSAICVGLSPIVFGVILEFMSPGYFDPVWNSNLAPLLLGAGLTLELIGFALIWKIAQIKV